MTTEPNPSAVDDNDETTWGLFDDGPDPSLATAVDAIQRRAVTGVHRDPRRALAAAASGWPLPPADLDEAAYREALADQGFNSMPRRANGQRKRVFAQDLDSELGERWTQRQVRLVLQLRRQGFLTKYAARRQLHTLGVDLGLWSIYFRARTWCWYEVRKQLWWRWRR